MKRLSLALRASMVMTLMPAMFGAEPAATNEHAIEIVRVWTHFRDAASFVRLAEYFSGKEATGDTIVLRSQPEVRDGFYFTVRIAAEDRARLQGLVLRLHMVPPDGSGARSYSFTVAADDRRSAHLEVGLTGTDWPYGDVLPLAWKLELLGADGRPLASEQSFLWTDRAIERDS